MGTGNGTALIESKCRGLPPGSARRDLAIPPGASGRARLAQPGRCRSLPPVAGYFAPSHGGTSKSAWGACAWPLPRRLRPQRPRRLRAKDIGRRASSLAYAAPISRSLATIQGNLTDDGRKIERAPRGRKVPRAVSGEHCGERLLHRSTPASESRRARVIVVASASPLASHPRLRTARHALCCVASHSCIGPAPSSGLASADEPGVVCGFGPT